MRIYCILNQKTGKKYIGQTTYSIEHRWNQHKDIKNSSCTYLVRAIEKYGIENFSIQEIRECSTQEDLDFYESLYITYLNTLAPNGYNLTEGGAAPKHSEVTKEKMSQTRKGKEPTWATEASHNPESNKKRAEALFGQTRTQEQVYNIRRGLSHKMKPIVDQNGAIYECINSAANQLKLNRANIQLVLRGKRNHTGGYKFKFL